jgi:prepilin-type N-terminal cleavage/methylation domain-containing protein
MGPLLRCRRGFTTIEVIAVLIIIGVLAAVIVARYWSTSPYTVRSVAEELKDHLRYAQTRAMNSNVIWGVNFVSTTQYTIFKDGDTSHTVTPPGVDSNTVSLSSRGASLGGIAAGDVVSFDDWGKPYTNAAGTTAQSGTRSITVSGGGQTATIQITQNTGYIP